MTEPEKQSEAKESKPSRPDEARRVIEEYAADLAGDHPEASPQDALRPHGGLFHCNRQTNDILSRRFIDGLTRKARGGTSRATTKDTMSKQDFIGYAKAMLTAASTKVLAIDSTDTLTAGRLNQIVRTAENVSDGYWFRIAPLYDPFAPKLQLVVRNVNSDIIAGKKTVPDFDSYIALLVSELQN